MTKMTTTSDQIDGIQTKYLEICRELNMDKKTEIIAWKNFTNISEMCTLTGDPCHWLCCAVYTACRESFTPTVGNSNSLVTGNCVSLTKLLRSCDISFFDFFSKMKQWARMMNLPERFSTQIVFLEESFNVSICLFRKFNEIFPKLFVISPTERKAKKAKPVKCSAIKLYNFCWYLFISAKGEKPESRNDFVMSYHLLLCCLDHIFVNAILENRKDLINPNFPKLPENWNSNDFDPSTAKDFCVIDALCDNDQAPYVDVMDVKNHTWKDIVAKFIEHRTIRCSSVFDMISSNYFEPNLKSLNNSYEQYVLSVGEFDESIFLSNPSFRRDWDSERERQAQMSGGKSYIPGTPVSNAACIQQLENISQKENPKRFLDQVSEKTLKAINERLKAMEKIFIEKCPENENLNPEAMFKLSTSLYFDILEKIVNSEKKENLKLEQILEFNKLHETLIVCCTEIVISVHDVNQPQIEFPWVLDCFDLNVFYFNKIIELVVKHNVGALTRPMINHLSTIEGICFESLMWRKESGLWDAIRQYKVHNKTLPKWEFVAAGNTNITGSARKNDELRSPYLTMGDESLSGNVGESARRDLFNAGRGRENSENGGNDTNEPKSQRASSLILFFRKFYELAYGTISKLCEGLHMKSDKHMAKIWTLFEYCITEKTEVMKDRHLLQIIMCTVYVFLKLQEIPGKDFAGIMGVCRQLQSKTKTPSSIYRNVLLKDAKDGREAVYGNIIEFYNSVYVQTITPFAFNFTDKSPQPGGVLLSPHPPEKMLSPKKISNNHQVYVAPLDKNGIPKSPNYITYEFHISPAKDLHRINQRVNGSSKRNANSEENETVVVSKVRKVDSPNQQSFITRKIQDIINDRDGDGNVNQN